MTVSNDRQGRAGYVRAVFSARCKGFALPLDLVRANLRACGFSLLSGKRKAAELVRVDPQDAELRDLEMRGRLAGAFADYLVSDGEGCGGSESGYPFVSRREHWRQHVAGDCVGMSGYRGGPAWVFDELQSEFDSVECLDAPLFMAAGGCRWSQPSRGDGWAAGLLAMREGW